ncbi:MAG: type IV secretion system protein TraC [Sutterella sp.]|nr:type IV secretion system protein TraC [Sutterella sp.]
MEVFGFRRQSADGIVDEDVRACQFCPVQAYDEQSKLFLCDDSTLGFAFECVPLAGGDQHTKERIEQLVAGDYPPGTIMQFFLYRSPDIEPQLNALARIRQDHMDGPLAGVVKQRIDFLRVHTKKNIHGRSFSGGDYDCGRIQESRLIVSIKIPFEGKEPNESDVVLTKTWETKTESALSSVGLWPLALSASRYIRLMQSIINWSPNASWRSMSVMGEWEEDKTISAQIFDPTTDLVIADKSTLQLGEHCFVKVMSAKRIPDAFFFTEAMKYVGNTMGGNDKLTINYAVCCNVFFPVTQSEKSKLETKRTWTVNQAVGPMLKFVPVLADKKHSFDILSESFQKGAKPIRMTFSVLLFSDSRKAVERAAVSAQSYWDTMHFHLMEDYFITAPMFQNCLPLCAEKEAVFHLDRYKTMTTRELPVLLPVFGEWKGTGTFHVALISRNGQLMSLSLHDSDTNKNAVIAAESGSGKSFLLNEIIVSYLSEGAQVWVIDAGKSYKKLNEQLDGDFLQFDEASKICLNPFELIDDWKEDEDTISALIAAMASEKEKLSDFQMAGLKQILKRLWETKGQTMTVDDIAAECLGHTEQRMHDIGQQLFSFTSKGGYGQYFHGHNTMRFENPFTVLELDELQGRTHLRQVVLMQLIFQIQREMYLGERNRKKIMIIDEAWDLIKSGPVSVFIEHGFRKFRKYGGSAIIATQSLNDLYENPVGRAIAENANMMLLLGQKPETIASIRDSGRLVLSEAGFNLLSTVASVGGVYSEIFVKSGHTGVGVGRLIVSNFEKMLFSTAPEDVNAIENYTNRGLNVTDAINHVLRDRGLNPDD